jgi:hypothetical protein
LHGVFSSIPDRFKTGKMPVFGRCPVEYGRRMPALWASSMPQAPSGGKRNAGTDLIFSDDFGNRQ